MPVSVSVPYNLVVRTPESIVSFGFFKFLCSFGLIFAVFYMYTNVISIFLWVNIWIWCIQVLNNFIGCSMKLVEGQMMNCTRNCAWKLMLVKEPEMAVLDKIRNVVSRTGSKTVCHYLKYVWHFSNMRCGYFRACLLWPLFLQTAVNKKRYFLPI